MLKRYRSYRRHFKLNSTFEFPSSPTYINNETVITLGFDEIEISDFGFNVEAPARSLLYSDESTVLAKYSDPDSGGRLLISTFSGFMARHVIDDEGSNSFSSLFLDNVIEYLTNNQRLDLVVDNSDLNGFAITVKNFVNGLPTNEELDVTVRYNDLIIADADYGIEQVATGTYNITFAFSGDGFYSIEVANTVEYTRIDAIIDTVGPEIVARFAANQSYADDFAEIIIYQFDINDFITDIKASKVSATIDGNNTGFYSRFNEANNVLTLSFELDGLIDRSQYMHTVTVSATDENGYTTVADFYFFTGEPPETTTSSEETTISAEMSSSSESESEEGPIFSELSLIVPLFVVFYFGYWVKRTKKQN